MEMAEGVYCWGNVNIINTVFYLDVLDKLMK